VAKMSALNPPPHVLAILGSIVTHIQEWDSASGHPFDIHAIRALLEDGDLKRWLAEMDKLAMIPKKRS
jgi:hypothetical protein